MLNRIPTYRSLLATLTATTLTTMGLAFTLTACAGVITSDEGAGVDPEQTEGAGGRDVDEYWPSIEIPLSQNTRMLSFEMLRNEVARATGQSWIVGGVDQWEGNRSAFGGADYQTTFVDDLVPSQQRLVLVRKMAFQVCGDLVAAEAGAASRDVFSVLDPAEPFVSTSEATAEQIRVLHRRFFLTDAGDEELAEGTDLLRAISPAGDDGPGAWQGLCVAYLGSMRFLTY